MRRVVVTGIGTVSALGNSTAEFWSRIAAGKSGIGPITRCDVSELRFKNAAEVKDFDPKEHFDDKTLTWIDLFCQYGMVAAREAVADSGIEFTPDLRENTGVITGSCLGGKVAEDEGFRLLYQGHRSHQPPTMIPKAMSNAVASQVSMEFGLTGATFTTSTACSSANHAIGQAFWLVRQGTLDAAVTGGSETPLTWGSLKAWEAMRVVSPTTCRPFSKDRNGMILGDGAAMFVIEELQSALARGARIYAEIAGFGMSADAHHLTMPRADGAAKAIRLALDDGHLPVESVGYINAHGTGTAANDSMETAAIRTVFGAHANRLAVSSTKSMHGHTLGAAGAIEMAATVLGIHHGLLPPTANFNERDPDCDLDVIPNEARAVEVEAALSNSFAFGGLNAAIAFRRWNGSNE